ncbi:hypothetical protein [Frigoriglobus tundricola]|uniref:Uncharacterized protein n=1 Tax=Frigoriglobus tundricola TaxID=2774151 RepID=A0A6M5YX84_9BACT|nr:hypothetical protein [Frigoriglobus tundricola]QJW98727.1 hypothetical protein FTUN_6322 [Frigoriglobus tundricola]
MRRKPGPDAGPLTLDLEALTPWAKGIARGVREDYGFVCGSQEEMELEGVALEALVELSYRFDEKRLPPGGDLHGLFRGWASTEVRSRCHREAIRLRNGGTFRTTASADARAMRVEELPQAESENGSEVTLPARAAFDPDEPEWEDLPTERRAVYHGARPPAATAVPADKWRQFLARRKSG